MTFVFITRQFCCDLKCCKTLHAADIFLYVNLSLVCDAKPSPLPSGAIGTSHGPYRTSWRLCCILKVYRFVHYFLFQFPGHLAALNVTSSRCFGNKCLGNKSQVVNTLATGVFSPQSSYDGKNKMHFITRVNFNSQATLYDF